jgi:hypothetical protein
MLPRHVPGDLAALQHALASVRKLDLQALDYPLPGADPARRQANGLSPLEETLKELEEVLPSWSNNLSSNYFSHARSFAINIGE